MVIISGVPIFRIFTVIHFNDLYYLFASKFGEVDVLIVFYITFYGHYRHVIQSTMKAIRIYLIQF